MDKASVYHPPPLFRYVSYVSPETFVSAGTVRSFRYLSDTEITPVDENLPRTDYREEFLPYSRSRSRVKARNLSMVRLPVSGSDGGVHDTRAVVRPFGYKTLYELIAVNQTTQEELSILATKKQTFLVWKGGYEKLHNLRKDSLLVVHGGARAVVKSVAYKGYLPANEVLLRDNHAYLANGFVCSNVVCYKKKKPAISYGIIGYRNGVQENGDSGIQFLLVRRKHTMGFMDLIRGRFYNQNMEDMVRVYLSEMTRDERQKITRPFDDLWDEIWANHKSKSYRNEYIKAKRKFAKVQAHLTQDVPCKYEVPEYGFPKGRKNKREDFLACAMREFEEETGVRRAHYTLVQSAPVFEEKFVATNGAEYCHVYYLARVDDNAPAPTIDSHIKQLEEIGSVEWRTPQECKDLFRSYDTHKKQIADDVYEFLKNGRFSQRGYIIN